MWFKKLQDCSQNYFPYWVMAYLSIFIDKVQHDFMLQTLTFYL